jgi:hypothetical protein
MQVGGDTGDYDVGGLMVQRDGGRCATGQYTEEVERVAGNIRLLHTGKLARVAYRVRLSEISHGRASPFCHAVRSLGGLCERRNVSREAPVKEEGHTIHSRTTATSHPLKPAGLLSRALFFGKGAPRRPRRGALR